MGISAKGMRKRAAMAGVMAVLMSLAANRAAQAQEESALAKEVYSKIRWQVGPAKVNIGSRATLDLPAGYRFTDAAGARTWAQITQNLYSDELGVVIPPLENRSSKDIFWVSFNFDEEGYVKDSDKLDQSTINSTLQHFQEGTEHANSARKAQGWEPLHVTGWSQPPFYDGVTHALSWGIKVAGTDGEESVNFDSRVLGRRGFMRVSMVGSAETVRTAMPTFQKIVTSIDYVSGEKYSEFRSGDKIAKYGLVGLMTGGAAVVAVKFWKPLIAFGAVIVGVIGSALKKVKNFFTGNKNTA